LCAPRLAAQIIASIIVFFVVMIAKPFWNHHPALQPAEMAAASPHNIELTVHNGGTSVVPNQSEPNRFH
jgi:hypothetical protein